MRRSLCSAERFSEHAILAGSSQVNMGYDGPANGLLDADTNLAFAVPYLANAYKVSGGNEARAIKLYAGGYYYEAKRKHLLDALVTSVSQ